MENNEASLQKPGFWKVFLAYMIDIFCTLLVVLLAYLLAFLRGQAKALAPDFYSDTTLITVVLLLFCVGFCALMEGGWTRAQKTFGRTVGKSIMNLHLINRLNTFSKWTSDKLFLAYLLDFSIIGILDFVCVSDRILRFFLVFLLSSLYFASTEGITGQSLGKKLFGIKVYQSK